MKSWNSTIAKQHFSRIIDDSNKEPQIVERRGKPVSVVISYDDFLKVKELHEKKSVQSWMSELKEINSYEDDMPEIVRSDRIQPDWD